MYRSTLPMPPGIFQPVESFRHYFLYQEHEKAVCPYPRSKTVKNSLHPFQTFKSNEYAFLNPSSNLFKRTYSTLTGFIFESCLT